MGMQCKTLLRLFVNPFPSGPIQVIGVCGCISKCCLLLVVSSRGVVEARMSVQPLLARKYL